MALKRQTRNAKTAIFPELRAYFEDGTWPGNKTEGDAECFIIMCSDEKLKAVWEECKDEILADWQKEKRPGRPWIETYLNGFTG